MDYENNKLDVVLPPNAFRLIRFLANIKRIPADEMATLIILKELRDYTEEAKKQGADIEKTMKAMWG